MDGLWCLRHSRRKNAFKASHRLTRLHWSLGNLAGLQLRGKPLVPAGPVVRCPAVIQVLRSPPSFYPNIPIVTLCFPEPEDGSLLIVPLKRECFTLPYLLSSM